ncbi:MAG TPA: ABC transporter permease [Vicinamibacterales bacterium]|nr:ABC transporter permease [Vicinamibacterales bacterium]
MKYVALIVKSARRSKRRTILTIASVALAVFLFASLRAILDGFSAASEASSSTRMITIRSTSMIFNMPTSHVETIRSIPGVRDVAWANWFGGIYKDSNNFFANIAVDAESYLRLYPEIQLTDAERQAFLQDRTGAIVGEGLAKRFGWKVGDTFVLKPGIPYYGTRDYNFTVRGVYKSGGAAIDNQSMFFHWKYADERGAVHGQVGWVVTLLANPDQATRVAGEIDARFANSPFETKTDTEKAFQSSFVSMFGNLNLLLGSIAIAVVITTLFVAGNTMAMSVRERTTEIAVMRTLGFPAGTIFGLIAGEALIMSVIGGVLGVVLARLVIRPEVLAGGAFIPALQMTNMNTVIALLLSGVIGVVAGSIPATMASRLKIVDALRRVA